MTYVHGRPPPFELFFGPLEAALTPNSIERIRFAYFVSKYGHADDTREDGSRYFDHPKGAAWIYISELGGRDERTIIDVLLHDISEDTYLLSPFRISQNFGEDIALDLHALTKLPKGKRGEAKETAGDYLGRVIDRGPWAILTKLLDRLHNMRTVHARSVEKRREQVEETQDLHLKLLVPALMRHGDPWTAHAKALHAKMLEAIAAVSLLA